MSKRDKFEDQETNDIPTNVPEPADIARALHQRPTPKLAPPKGQYEHEAFVSHRMQAAEINSLIQKAHNKPRLDTLPDQPPSNFMPPPPPEESPTPLGQLPPELQSMAPSPTPDKTPPPIAPIRPRRRWPFFFLGLFVGGLAGAAVFLFDLPAKLGVLPSTPIQPLLSASQSQPSTQEAQPRISPRERSLLLKAAHDALQQDPTEAIAWLKALPDDPTLASFAHLITLDAQMRGVSKRVLTGHKRPITALTISQDMKWIASASEDRAVILWETSTGVSRILKGHEHTITSLSFSKDNALLASGSRDKTVRIWDISSQKSQAFAVKSAVLDVRFGPAGALFAASTEDGAVHLWDVSCITPGKPSCDSKIVMKHDGAAYVVRFSADETKLASAGADKKLRVLSLGEQSATTYDALTAELWDLTFTADGQSVFTSGSDGTVRQWSLSDPKKKAMPLMGHEGATPDLELSPDGKFVASVGFDGKVKLWKVKDSLKSFTLEGYPARLYRVSFSPSGKELLAAGKEGEVWRWSLACLAEKGDLCNVEQVYRGHTGAVSSLLFFGEQAFASAGQDLSVRLWEVSAPMTSLWKGHDAGINAAALSSDGSQLATASDDKNVRLWDMKTGKNKPLMHKNPVTRVSFSPDGMWLATLTSKDELKLWDVAKSSGKSLSGHKGAVLAIVFSPDSKRLATAGADKSIRIWEIGTDKTVVLEGHKGPIHDLVYSMDGKWLASASEDKIVRLWDTESKQGEQLIRHKEGVLRLAFSPDSKRLVSASRDQTIISWEVSTLKSTLLEGHQGAVTQLAFSPDGMWLASAGADKTVRIWSGDMLHRMMEGHTEEPTQLKWVGSFVMSGSKDRSVRLWDVESGLGWAVISHRKEVVGIWGVEEGMKLFSVGRDQTIRFVQDQLPRDLGALRAHWDVLTSLPPM